MRKILLILLLLLPVISEGAFPDDWGRKLDLDIQSSQVSANLSYFPVLLTVDTFDPEMFDTDDPDYAANKAQADCGDLRFYNKETPSTENDGRLATEIVSCSHGSSPSIEIWVEVDSISSATDTTIWVYYNATGKSQPAEGSTYGKHDTWDENASGDFKLVQHLNEDPSGGSPQAVDSTGNNNDGTSGGTMSSGDLDPAKIGNGWHFDGSNDYSDHGNGASLQITGNITISCWINADQLASSKGSSMTFCGKTSQYASNEHAYTMFINDDNDKLHGLYSGDSNWPADEAISNSAISASTWYLVHFVKNSSVGTLYVNGSSQTATQTGEGASIYNTANEYLVGQRDNNESTFDGIIDEARVSNTARSGDWILAEYNNQNSPSTFVIEGTPQDVSGTPPATPNFLYILISKLGIRGISY